MLLYLFSVHALWSVERLYERGGLSDEQRVERGSGQHADNGQPDVGHALRGVPAVADAQHVWQRLEQCPRILFRPRSSLHAHPSVATLWFSDYYAPAP